MITPPRPKPYPLALYFPDREDIDSAFKYVSMLEKEYGIKYNCFFTPGWLVCTVIDKEKQEMKKKATRTQKHKSLKELLDTL